MTTDLNDPNARDETLDDEFGPRGAGASGGSDADGETGGATLIVDAVETAAGVESAPADDGGATAEAPVAPVSAGEDEPASSAPSAPWPPMKMAAEDIDVAQLFRDRPDVFQGFFTEFYGPHNDHHSNAWNDRVGGETPEAYALYWYKTYGFNEGYQPTALVRPPASPVEPEVRTTADGIPLDQILHDRPDVFQGFFTEFYGPNNDRHSSAWDNRVGGETLQDYANYWYETYGKAAGYGAQFHSPAPVEEDGGTADGLSAGEVSPFGALAGDSASFVLT